MSPARHLLWCFAACLVASTSAYLAPEEIRHEQLTAMQAAFSRFAGGGAEGSIERADLPNFVRFVFKAMNSPGVTPEQVVARSTELTQRLVKQLPQDAAHFSLGDVLYQRLLPYCTLLRVLLGAQALWHHDLWRRSRCVRVAARRSAERVLEPVSILTRVAPRSSIALALKGVLRLLVDVPCGP